MKNLNWPPSWISLNRQRYENSSNKFLVYKNIGIDTKIVEFAHLYWKLWQIYGEFHEKPQKNLKTRLIRGKTAKSSCLFFLFESIHPGLSISEESLLAAKSAAFFSKRPYYLVGSFIHQKGEKLHLLLQANSFRKLTAQGVQIRMKKRAQHFSRFFRELGGIFNFSAVFYEIYHKSTITWNISDRIQRFWCLFLHFNIRGVYWNDFRATICSAKSKMAAISYFFKLVP